MITVKVRKEEILEALAKNQERYQTTRVQLVEAYKVKATEYQILFATYVQKRADDTLTEDDHEPGSPYLPEDRNKDYVAYIAMVTSHIDASIDLDYQGYRKLVLDKWEWMQSHVAAITNYNLADAAIMYIGEA